MLPLYSDCISSNLKPNQAILGLWFSFSKRELPLEIVRDTGTQLSQLSFKFNLLVSPLEQSRTICFVCQSETEISHPVVHSICNAHHSQDRAKLRPAAKNLIQVSQTGCRISITSAITTSQECTSEGRRNWK